MSADTVPFTITNIEGILVEHGFEILHADDDTLTIRDTESGIILALVLEEQVLINTISLLTVPRAALTLSVYEKLLRADNGVSMSAFKVYDHDGGKVTLTLTNFCKLQDLNAEDVDDILSCVNFLVADAISARDLLPELRS